MCIIVYKEAKVALPSREVLQDCWDNNPDGAGFMYYDGGNVAYEKGFMKFEDFYKAFQAAGLTAEDTVAIHFRIATAGGVSQGNCHPFMVSEQEKELKALIGAAPNVMMHNGILGAGTKSLSDTQLFVKDVLFNLIEHISEDKVFKAVEKITVGSKLIIFTKKTIYFTGQWVEDKESGLWFSNSTYKKAAHYYSYLEDAEEESWWAKYNKDKWSNDKSKGESEDWLANYRDDDGVIIRCTCCGNQVGDYELTAELCCPFCHEDLAKELVALYDEAVAPFAQDVS
jgi:predicted glutamine amidotransferase